MSSIQANLLACDDGMQCRVQDFFGRAGSLFSLLSKIEIKKNRIFTFSRLTKNAFLKPFPVHFLHIMSAFLSN